MQGTEHAKETYPPESSTASSLFSGGKDHPHSNAPIDQTTNGELEPHSEERVMGDPKPASDNETKPDQGAPNNDQDTVEALDIRNVTGGSESTASLAEEKPTEAFQPSLDGSLYNETREEESVTDLSESTQSYSSEAKPDDALQQSQECGSEDTSYFEADRVVVPSSGSSSIDGDTSNDDNQVLSSDSLNQDEMSSDGTKTSNPIDRPKHLRKGSPNIGLIDTAAPFESVKAAVSKFGGIVDWKAHKVQTAERRKIVEQELEKAQSEIPIYKMRSEAAEDAKAQVLKELNSTRRLVEEFALNLERALTEEQQAKQDAELTKLRVEEMEQGIADEVSVAAKAQLEVAQARHATAVSELATVKEELEKLHNDYALLVIEKDMAVKRAQEAGLASKEVEKTVEDLTIELMTMKESLEYSQAAHLEIEEQRVRDSMAIKQETLSWEKELKEAQDELESLNQKISSAKDLKSKLETASALLADLKGELAAYMESQMKEEYVSEGYPENGMLDIQAEVTLAMKELEEIKVNMEKATAEVNCLKVAATSLNLELEGEKSALAAMKQREEVASITVASLEAEVGKTKSEIAVILMKEKELRENMVNLPEKLQEAAQEADRAKSLVQVAREELHKAREEADQAKIGASAMKSRLLAAKAETDTAKASEKLALAAINALKDSELAESANGEDSPAGVTLTLEEYYELSKHAHDTEEEANMRVAAAMSEMEVAKESEQITLKKLEEVNKEVAVQKEELETATQKAEKAKEGKMGAEQELRKWRAESEQRRKAGESVHGASNIDLKEDSVQALSATIPFHQRSSPKAYAPGDNTEADASPDVMVAKKKKKKKSFFPRVFMFLGRKKTNVAKSM